MSTLLLLKDDNAELEPLGLNPPLIFPPPIQPLPLERSIPDIVDEPKVGVRALVIPPGELQPLGVPSAFNVPGISTVDPDVFLKGFFYKCII